MTSDSGLFRTAAQLDAEGWTLDGNRYRKGPAQMLPLYEAKLMHQFDHRFATYTENGETRDITSAEKADPDCLPLPRYWVAEAEVEDRLIQKDKNGRVTWEWTRDWLMGFRDIARVTDERTAIFGLFPPYGSGNTMPFMFSGTSALAASALFIDSGTTWRREVNLGGAARLATLHFDS